VKGSYVKASVAWPFEKAYGLMQSIAGYAFETLHYGKPIKSSEANVQWVSIERGPLQRTTAVLESPEALDSLMAQMAPIYVSIWLIAVRSMETLDDL
jgi:hypothetical protein